MKLLQFALLILMFLSACTDADAPKDTETNRYYADYIQIYNAYDSLGGEQTLEHLDIYMKEFPERKEAYVFKGYILGKMGEYEQADILFDEAKKRDSVNLNIYEYQSAFLLYDSTKFDKAQKIIFEGLAISDSSSSLYNNLAWLQIFEKDYEGALESVTKAATYHRGNINVYRPGLIAAHHLGNEKYFSYYKNFLLSNEIDPAQILEVLEIKGAFGLYKSIDQ